jgi:hypothetical protein
VAKKTRLKRTAAESYESYAIQVHKWSPSYSLHFNVESKNGDNPLSDILLLEIDGEALAPAKIVGKSVAISVYGTRKIDAQLVTYEKAENKPIILGLISSRQQQCNIYGYVPYTSMPSILAMFSAGKCYGVIIGGTKLRYGQAIIHSLSFNGEQEFFEGW